MSLWSNEADSLRFSELLRQRSPFRFSGGGSGDAQGRVNFSLTYDTLAYESVQTLDDCAQAALLANERQSLGSELPERARSLLDEAFSNLVTKGEWPSATHVAVRRRDLGFVPGLQDALMRKVTNQRRREESRPALG